MGQAECTNCGAAPQGNEIICRFCHSPISQAALDSAVTCPQCRTPNHPGFSNCVSCNGSLLTSCLFCGHASPISRGECEKCGEAFAGAAERKSAKERAGLLDKVENVVSQLITGNQGSSNYSYDSRGSGSSGGGGSYGGGSSGGAPPMDE